jgi:hypothetical protein
MLNKCKNVPNQYHVMHFGMIIFKLAWFFQCFLETFQLTWVLFNFIPVGMKMSHISLTLVAMLEWSVGMINLEWYFIIWNDILLFFGYFFSPWLKKIFVIILSLFMSHCNYLICTTKKRTHKTTKKFQI